MSLQRYLGGERSLLAQSFLSPGREAPLFFPAGTGRGGGRVRAGHHR